MYLCEVCGLSYDNPNEASGCEDRHTYLNIEPQYALGKMFPVSILVSYIEDEKVVAYGEYYISKDGVKILKEGLKIE